MAESNDTSLEAGQEAWYIEPPFDLLANHFPCVIQTVSGKRVALRFSAHEMTPAELHNREMIVPTHSYGTRFCRRYTTQNEADLPEDSLELFTRDLLESRSRHGEIYTYAGSQLLALNLFTSPNCFDAQTMRRYLGTDKHREDNPAHLYAVLNDMANALKRDSKPQMLVLGSNGPGTGISFTLNQSLSFFELAYGSADAHFSDRVTTALYILHTFTNAKMSRNDDSCRATLSVKLGVHSDEIASAHVEVFGLDTSRVIFQGPCERNYHVFYQLLAGADEEMKQKYFLKDAASYKYLNRRINNCEVQDDEPVCFEVRNPEGVKTKDDASDFQDLVSLLNAVSVPPAKQDHILRTLSAILLIGNLEFEGEEAAVLTNPELCDQIAELLRLPDAEALASCFVRCTRHVVGDDPVVVAYLPKAAAHMRDALAQQLYSALVDFVSRSVSWRPEEMTDLFLGISVPTTAEFLYDANIDSERNYCNRYPQLLRNLLHEVVMNFRNEYTLYAGKEHWRAQGMEQELMHAGIEVIDNSTLLDLIAGPDGILKLTDDYCKQKWLDSSVHKLAGYIIANCSENPLFLECDGHPEAARYRYGASAAAVHHTWGKVIYDFGDEFVRAHAYDGRLLRVAYDVLSESALPHVASYAMSRLQGDAHSAARMFKESIEKYLQLLTQAHPYFVTTASANRSKAEDRFERQYVINQLEYTGSLPSMVSEQAFR